MSSSVEIVCLSPAYDLKELFGAAFGRVAEGLALLRPDEVTDPDAIRVAMVHNPGPEDFKAFPNIELICTWGAGVDGLLYHPALPEGAVISRMIDPGQAQMMAATSVYYTTAWHREMFGYPEQQARREWTERAWVANADFPVGILGYGKMGAATGQALAALGYPVLAWANRARREDGIEVLAGPDALDRVLAEARVLICVLPLTPETEGILNARSFARMRPDALLVQLARGGHLVEEDLIPALDAGRPHTAALDVFQTEPLPQDHPFWAHPRIMVTPHIGSSASERGVAQSVANAVEAHRRGARPAGYVDLSKGY